MQLNEGLASAGLVLTALGLAVYAGSAHAWPDPRAVLREWAPLWAFLAWALVAPVLAGHPPTSTGVARLLDWAGLPVAAAALALQDGRRRRVLAWVVGAVFLLSCAAAGLQHFGLWPSEETMSTLSWTRIPFNRVYEIVPGHEGRYMAGGLLFHRLKFANVGGLCVIWALALGLKAKGRDRVLGVGVAAFGFVALLAFPYARAASAALVLALGPLLLMLFRNRLQAIALASGLAMVAVAVVLASPSVRQRFLSSNLGEGSGDRPYFLAAALNAVKQHPVTGIGPGRFRPALFAIPGTPQDVMEHRGKSHNQLLSLATEIGIPGVLLFIVLLTWLAQRMGHGDAAEAGRACLVFFALVSLLHDPLFHPESSMAMVLALGAASSLGSATHRRPDRSR